MYILISGGLGNQLFQFTFAKYVSLKFKKNVSLIDCTDFAIKKRKWELHNIKIKKNQIPKLVIIFIYYLSKLNIAIYRKFNFIFLSFFFFEHKKINFSNKAPIVLYGYWQNIVYLKQNDNYIKNKILNNIIKNKILFNNFKINKNKKNIYVAIHVRRDDYFSSKDNSHGICNPLWYLKAFNKLKINVTNIVPIIFSDDINYVKCKLNIKGYIWKSSSKESNFSDLAIMSMCDHFIISNSTYSWWAAWLSQNRNKKVIVPKFWTKNLETSRLNFIPKKWTVL
jgi:hypothetical protein